jgi:hypothetical protein
MRSPKLFSLAWPGTFILKVSASSIAWDDRYTPLLLAIDWHGVFWTPCLCWPQSTILPVSASQVAITGRNYQCLANTLNLTHKLKFSFFL